MAKHIAYPTFFAFIFCNFTANSVESLKENDAIFSKYTSCDSEAQLISLVEEKTKEAEAIPTSVFDAQTADKKDGIDAQVETPLTPTSARILHHARWVEILEETPPTNHLEHKKAFEDSLEPGAYHSPVKVGKNTYYFLKGVSPKKTPRRRQNFTRLKEGKSPIWVDEKTGQVSRCEMHHVGQANDNTYIVMLPVIFHKKQTKRFHTESRDKPSKINRSEFADDKRAAFKKLSKKFKKMRDS